MNNDDYHLSPQYSNKLLKLGIFVPLDAITLMDILPNRITIQEGLPFNSFLLRIQKSFIVKDLISTEKGNIKTQTIYIANYHCDSTEGSGSDAWLERKLLLKNIWDVKFLDCLAKLLLKLIQDNLYVYKENL
jgi:hypothetical protein